MPFKKVTDGVTVAVRLTPNAKKSIVEGIHMLENGSCVLKVRVNAVPEKGQANEALIALLAHKTGMARSRITLTSGATSRLKKITFAGDPEALLALLNTLYPEAEYPR